MKKFKQLLSELNLPTRRNLDDAETKRRTGFYGSMKSDNPDTYLDDEGLSRRSPPTGTAVQYTQKQKGPMGVLGGFVAAAAKYGGEFSRKHGYTPIAGQVTEPPMRSYDPKASIKANERGGDIRNQIMADHKAQIAKINVAYKADLAALNKKKGSMDPAEYQARVQELARMRQTRLGTLRKVTASKSRGARTRAAHLKDYYGYTDSGQPDTDRGFEGGSERV